MPSFTQRNMFDVLDIEDGPDYEEVVEEYVFIVVLAAVPR